MAAMSEQGLAGADTLPRDDGGEAERAPPVVSERYEMIGLLGTGGMAEVYRARDRQLDRMVALKFIAGADPNLRMRFLREARAQARIDHPNVCRVYEVGELAGRAYLALQLVDGEPLHRAAARMSLDDKVWVMRAVALAIHEAHRLGIVHRDVKPSNVMVDRTEDGRWFPVVMDFGLARQGSSDARLTASGAPLGTPAYMSPEQARGESASIDRRSDVYGLGATLYELLTGRPPFFSESVAVALAQVIHDEPLAPSRVSRSVPRDLETIALGCLAKDPAQRYPSARALADDLGRYLDGEPIVGRRPSLWQRLRRRARRQRAVVAVAASSAVIIAIVAALGVRAWLIARGEQARTAERTRLAEQLGRDAKEMELSLRSAYQLPMHDTRPEREATRARLRAIAATRHDLGALGDAAIHNALGRGHLALSEWQEAADELARAADAGLQAPGLHLARGRALGELYHSQVDDARRSGDKAWLARRRGELEQQYLAPALAELDRARAAGESGGLLEAQLALYRGEFAAAEQRARAAGERAEWVFEATRLAATAAHSAATAAFDRGDYAAARPGLEHAAALYAEAGEVARSDAEVHEAAAQTELLRAELEFRQGRSPREPLDRALGAVDRALRADPDRASAYTTRAYALLRWVRTPALRGPDDREMYERMVQDAGRAVELDPLHARAWDALGNALVARGRDEFAHGGDGPASWRRALEAFGRAIAIEPDDPWANNDAGTAHRWLGESLEDAGHDPMAEYQAALASYERATALDPEYLYAWNNQADIHELIAEHDRARAIDPRPAVERAERAGERGLAIDATYYLVLDSLAQAQLVAAHYLVDTGGDPSAAIARARGYLDRADAAHPGHWVTSFHRIVAGGAEAAARVRDGGDPAGALAAGRTAFAEARRLRPDAAAIYVEAARIDLVEVAWLARGRRSALPMLAQARTHADRAVVLDPQSAEARFTSAEVCLRGAEAQPARATVERCLAELDRAVALSPRLPRAPAVRAELERLRERTAPTATAPR
jgi:eukaryotic-like serine/threonine-protein kinase